MTPNDTASIMTQAAQRLSMRVIVHYVGTITHPLIRGVLRQFIAPPALSPPAVTTLPTWITPFSNSHPTLYQVYTWLATVTSEKFSSVYPLFFWQCIIIYGLNSRFGYLVAYGEPWNVIMVYSFNLWALKFWVIYDVEFFVSTCLIYWYVFWVCWKQLIILVGRATTY